VNESLLGLFASAPAQGPAGAPRQHQRAPAGSGSAYQRFRNFEAYLNLPEWKYLQDLHIHSTHKAGHYGSDVDRMDRVGGGGVYVR
jgi:hypothetical protein